MNAPLLLDYNLRPDTEMATIRRSGGTGGDCGCSLLSKLYGSSCFISISVIRGLIFMLKESFCKNREVIEKL